MAVYSVTVTSPVSWYSPSCGVTPPPVAPAAAVSAAVLSRYRTTYKSDGEPGSAGAGFQIILTEEAVTSAAIRLVGGAGSAEERKHETGCAF